MTALLLSLAYLRQRLWATILTILLMAVGVGTIVLLLLVGRQMQDRLAADAAGVDLVVGAKGSPLQLILSALYQIDVPTGNIPLAAARTLAADPLVARSVALAMGDGYRGFRIVGTEPEYLTWRGADLADGRVWQAPLEAVLGATVAKTTGLGIGDSFAGGHGVGGDGGDHAAMPYRVVGILRPSGGVADRLILTGIDSVWKMHETHATSDPGGQEVTALLIGYRSPVAAVRLPRRINSDSALQAAAPAVELTRLLSLLGFGFDTLRGFGILLVGAAAFSVLITLSQAAHTRRYDLAIMRGLGAGRVVLITQLLVEAGLVSGIGALVGTGLGHVGVAMAAVWVPGLAGLGLDGSRFVVEEWAVPVLALMVAVLAALPAAIAVYRADVSAILARG